VRGLGDAGVGEQLDRDAGVENPCRHGGMMPELVAAKTVTQVYG
jgi:hypothetical protein